jgi:hypothetical protein
LGDDREEWEDASGMRNEGLDRCVCVCVCMCVFMDPAIVESKRRTKGYSLLSPTDCSVSNIVSIGAARVIV